MKNALLFGAGILGLAASLSLARAGEHTKDTPDAVKKAVADGTAVLVDVREQSEWDAGHLKVAKLLPLSGLDEIKADELARKVPKGKVVYCHCAAGGRSLMAAEILEKFGYDVRPLKPGYNELLKAGFEAAPR